MDKHMMSKKEMEKEMVGKKIKKLMKEGKKKSQAVAIALNMAREHKV
jgi:hypothetical protein